MKILKLRSQKSSQRSRSALARAGATAVEFSLTLPILLLFLFATFELGRGNMMLNTTEAAAYEACRIVIIPGATVAEAQASAERVLATAGISEFTFSIVPEDLSVTSEVVEVRLDVPYADNSLLVPNFFDSARFVRNCVLSRENQ